MSLYFAGTEILDFGTSVVSGYSTSTGIHNTWTRYGIGIIQGPEDLHYLDCPFLASTSGNVWVHWAQQIWISGGSSSKRYFKLYNSGVQVLGLFRDSNGAINVVLWNGSAWTTVLTAPAATSSGFYSFDMYIAPGNPGTIAVWADGVSVAYNSALNLSSVSTFDKLRLQATGTAGSGDDYFSEVIVADWNTIGARIISQAPTGVGNYGAWTGSYTDVDEAGDGDTNYITSATADARESFTFPAISLNSGENIVAVGVGADGGSDLSSPQNINLFTRVSGSDYDDTDQALQAGINILTPKIWETNPATSAAWTAADVNAAELGVRARA